MMKVTETACRIARRVITMETIRKMRTAHAMSAIRPESREYGNNDTSYIINGQIQHTIDINDNNIFKHVVAVSWGIQIATDIPKSFIF